MHFLGENRHQTVLNPEFIQNPEKLPLYNCFGKLIAIACRHAVMVPLSLPDMIWKPLVGESLEITDLKAIDVHTVRSLGEIAQGRVPHSQALELLTQALLSSSLKPQGGLFANHSLAATLAVKSFISPHTSILDNPGTGVGPGAGAEPGPSAESVPAIIDDESKILDATRSVTSSSSSSSASSSSTSSVEAQRRVRAVCELLLQSHLTTHATGLEHVYKGMAAVLPAEIFAMFSPAELRTIFCGQPEVDLEVLKRATVYEGGTAATDR